VLGKFSTYYDDANIYGIFEADPGAVLVRTSLGIFEEEENIPIDRDGKVVAQRLPLQTRPVPPAMRVRHRVFMDSVNDYLGHYRALPRAILEGADGHRYERWAGTRIPRPINDTIARELVMQVNDGCTPRVVVLTDRALLDNGGWQANRGFVDPLWWLPEQPRYQSPATLPRQRGLVLFDRGRHSPCWADGSCGDSALSQLRTLMLSMTGVPVAELFSSPGSLTAIPPEFGLLFLWLPREGFTVEEINVLKLFVAEGGRVVYVSEESGYYDAAGRATLDQFLADMGSTARSLVGAYDCGGYRDLPMREEVPHRMTAWMSTHQVQCTGALTTGFLDFNYFHDAAHRVVTGASVAVDTVPIVAHAPLGS
jgi:hypothetical protein